MPEHRLIYPISKNSSPDAHAEGAESPIADERVKWTKGMIRMAADVANEKRVMVRLQTDGNILILPLPETYKEDLEKWETENSGLKPW